MPGQEIVARLDSATWLINRSWQKDDVFMELSPTVLEEQLWTLTGSFLSVRIFTSP